MVEFALVLPIMLMMFIAIADFGRIFAAMITLESATRDAAEAAANQYLANPPGGGSLTLPAPQVDPTYYDALHTRPRRSSAQTCAACRTPTTTPGPTRVRTCRS